jgi:hypothetical protein
MRLRCLLHFPADRDSDEPSSLAEKCILELARDGGASYQVTLAATSGRLMLTASGAATVTGANTATVTVTGSLADVNATLSSLVYKAVRASRGVKWLTVTTVEQGTSPVQSDTDTVMLVVGKNHRPSTTPGAFGYTGHRSTTLTVPADKGVVRGKKDSDGDPLTAALLTRPGFGDLNLNPEGSFSYMPPTNFTGKLTFTFRYFDGEKFSDPVKLTLKFKFN